ncbi:citrate-binding protein-like [Elaeis guineensis]|uniref:Citrate-binding protein-like n=1 Tax=Elaeis guineensis var. tenera TaxID=51953 RepID=A0A8N4IFI6_ELAGV|nr:citrate-binding protein-like [Elaeis guineensis]
MSSYLALLVPVCLVVLQFHGHIVVAWPPDPTYGFISLPLNNSNFHIQKPYDLPVSERYSFIDGIHKLWVLSTDKPHSLTSHTAPRTEIGIRGYAYSSGVWQFEGHAYIPSGTTGVCIMQIFGANRTATTLMLRVYNGALMYYKSQVIVDDIYGRWFRVNVIHDIGAKLVKVFIDGELKLAVNDRGGALHSFKCGVYAQNDNSYFMESQWKNIKVLKLPD